MLQCVRFFLVGGEVPTNYVEACLYLPCRGYAPGSPPRSLRLYGFFSVYVTGSTASLGPLTIGKVGLFALVFASGMASSTAYAYGSMIRLMDMDLH